MRFLAWLDAPLVNRLLQVLDANHLLHSTSRRDEFLQRLRDELVDVAVIDPSLGAHGTRDADSSIAPTLLAVAPKAAVIVYGQPVQHVVAELGLIARNHRTLFVVRGARDEPAQLRLAVALATAVDPTFELLARLESLLAKLPGPLSRAIALALERPEDIHRVSDLAFATGKSERTLNRWLDNVGLHSAGYFVTAAHLLYAYRLLRQPSRVSCVRWTRRRSRTVSRPGWRERTRTSRVRVWSRAGSPAGSSAARSDSDSRAGARGRPTALARAW
jgi:hypothetical protein